jgi:DNA invertase Pin-like site-specific DNA recombinase
MNAALWIRVSGDEQETSNQVPDLEGLAERQGYTITRRYVLEDSAWNGGKDGGEYQAALQRALDDAWQGRFSVLIVWALDRITREGAEGALRTIRQFRERGCIVISVKESWLNASPEVQDILVAFAGWMAKQESDRRSERIRAGMKRAAAQGKQVGGRKAGARDKRPSVARSEGNRAAWARRKAAQT